MIQGEAKPLPPPLTVQPSKENSDEESKGEKQRNQHQKTQP
jgi:hypothetical protein